MRSSLLDGPATSTPSWRSSIPMSCFEPTSARAVRGGRPSSEAPKPSRVKPRMANRAAKVHPALVNGAAGAVVTVRGRPFAVMGFTVAEGKIVEIDAIGDPARVRRIAAAVLANE